MKYLVSGGVVFLALCTELQAGGLERSDQSVNVLFENGRHLELGYGMSSPEVSGVGVLRSPGVQTGNIAQDSSALRLAYKDDINAALSYAIIVDQPYGAEAAYPTGTGYFAQGAFADLSTVALTTILQYNIGEAGSAAGGQFSVFGGARMQKLDLEAGVPFVGGYQADGDAEVAYGYLVGVAWERPELAMRVSLTYSSKMTHEVETSERATLPVGGIPTPLSVTSMTEVETPESLMLEFATGINQNTALFGSVRWVPWSDFSIAPTLYSRATGGPLAFYADDRITYRLGLARRLSESWNIFGEVSHETSTGSPTSNLSAVDGFTSVSLGATYKRDRARYTLAVRYADLGDADTTVQGVSPAGSFTDNSAWQVGFRVAFDLN